MRQLGDRELKSINKLVKLCMRHKVEMMLHHGLEGRLDETGDKVGNAQYFNRKDNLKKKGVDFFVCIGGDGTMLDSILYVKDTGIPVLGINTGRLGYLSTVGFDDIESMLSDLSVGDYRIVPRTALESKLITQKKPRTSFALNDISVHKRDTSAMITIHSYLNDEYFNTYWADGLLVSTPTGSTAYSLSCGGPIMFPDAQGLMITPVAPHNLNVRPIIVSDETTIRLKVEGRGGNYLMALDSRNKLVDYQSVIEIRKADFHLNLVSLTSKTFSKTLQDKLNWGRDNRNLA